MQQELDTLIDTVAPLLGLEIEPAWREAVRTHLAISLRHARAVADFPLPDDADPAPAYRA
jgi:hypothetical protein